MSNDGEVREWCLEREVRRGLTLANLNIYIMTLRVKECVEKRETPTPGY